MLQFLYLKNLTNSGAQRSAPVWEMNPAMIRLIFRKQRAILERKTLKEHRLGPAQQHCINLMRCIVQLYRLKSVT